jgi:hypothetical protein
MKRVPLVAAVAAVSIAGLANAQCGTSGSCFEVHGPYCNDADCCNAVCAIDSYCCAINWDQFCVNEANSLCLGCGNPGTGSCYATGGPYCNDAECCNYVCSLDPFCCNISWDSLCVQEAVTNCGTCGAPASGDCFVPGGPACNDQACCNTVCGVDPFCCNVAWDAACVNEAFAYCSCGGAATHSCFSTGGPFCNDAACCDLVCGLDPFCCNVAWDLSCVTEANSYCLGCGGVSTGSCFEAHGPFCNDEDCCNMVCSVDAFCCNVQWDAACVIEATQMCLTEYCGAPGGHSCFVGGEPYCNDAACCNTVCAIDPFCCENAWDSLCVTEAFINCLGCGDPTTGSCYATHGPACDDWGCCQTVCSVDMFCCDVQWDIVCVNEAVQLCGAPPCPADIDGDGIVGPADLATLLGAWSTPFADLNGDGITGAPDLALLLGEWGPC